MKNSSMKHQVVAIVPIKLNNKRLPGKNLKYLGSNRLLNYILNELKGSECISRVIVCCSDTNIVKYLPQGVEFIQRPISLDRDDTNFTEIFDFILNHIIADIYVYAHATAPFLKTDSINKCIEAVTCEYFDSAFSAVKLQDFLWSTSYDPINFNPSKLPRSQDLPTYYRETSGVYVFKRHVFEDHKTRIGLNPKAVEVSWVEAIDINTAEDFKLAELVMKKRVE